MCGIAGVLHRSGRPVAPELIQRLCSLLAHRGPDDEGFFVGDGFGCGARRLSIIDLQLGRQPIFRDDGRLVMVFNGELYNYRQIRTELIGLGHRFATAGDGEVILAAYQQWGQEAFSRFNGMYALAIHDTHSGELLLVRDRLGIKPLFYWDDGATLVFGSEMKVVLAHPQVPRRLAAGTLAPYLAYGYHPCEGETAVANVKLLPPASVLRFTPGGASRISSYWEIPPVPDSNCTESEEETAERLYTLLVDAVRARLVSDVEICVMLSSGLDSGTLAHILHRELQTPLRAFSIGLESRVFDESRDAGRLAGAYRLPWVQETLQPRWIEEELDRIIHHGDSLQGNTAQIIYYFCNRLIHRHGFKVTLNGSGGDELFFGYPTYRADLLFHAYRRLPGAIRTALARAAQHLPASAGRVSFDFKLKQFTAYSGDDRSLAHASWRTVFSPHQLRQLVRPEHHERLGDWRSLYGACFAQMPPAPFFHSVQVADLSCWLIPLLVWVDGMSMAHSVELRVPFLDHRLVEEVVRLPPSRKFRGWQLKRLMRRFLRHRLPQQTLRLAKRGTHVPLGSWLNGELRGLLEDRLAASRLRQQGLLDPAEVERLKQEHSSGKANHTFRLWHLIMLTGWMERFGVTP